jgi:hypothetical protein
MEFSGTEKLLSRRSLYWTDRSSTKQDLHSGQPLSPREESMHMKAHRTIDMITHVLDIVAIKLLISTLTEHRPLKSVLSSGVSHELIQPSL